MREAMREGISVLEGGRDSRGPLLVLLHGLGATKEAWLSCLKLFDAKWDGDWIAPDFPGHGSSSPSVRNSYGGYAEAIARVIPSGRAVVVLGHSLGGVVGLMLGSGLFGVEVKSVHALSVKVRWTTDEIVRILEFSRSSPKLFDNEEDAVTRFLKVSGLYGLVGEHDPRARAGVISIEGRYRLAALPSTNAVASGDCDAVRSICKSATFFATGSADPIAPASCFDAVGLPVTVLSGLEHNAHVQDPGAVCNWFFTTYAEAEAQT